MTRSERIREAVRITDLLAELGYGVQPIEREQQFGCDLHGTRDSKPSARVYPTSNSWYCFACGKSRDAIRTVMDKLDLDFKKAMSWLEKTYNLPSWEPTAAPEDSLKDSLETAFTGHDSTEAEKAKAQVWSLLSSQRHDKALSCAETMSLWEEYDSIKNPSGYLDLRDEILKKVRDAARVS